MTYSTRCMVCGGHHEAVARDGLKAGDCPNENTMIRLTEYFGRKKAIAILDAVDELPAAQIAHALDFKASEKREADKREQAIQMAKERGLGL